MGKNGQGRRIGSVKERIDKNGGGRKQTGWKRAHSEAFCAL